ncbi:hypothetical protein K3495_g11846 [Podosphaera aphanis]|nr:hypothetical protein K3495_g11846 [Podosphaera aphanis]
MEPLIGVNSRRLSLQGTQSTTSKNKVPLQPASLEVISNLISSLSSISTPIQGSDISPPLSPRSLPGLYSRPSSQNDTHSKLRREVNCDSHEALDMRQMNQELPGNGLTSSKSIGSRPSASLDLVVPTLRQLSTPALPTLSIRPGSMIRFASYGSDIGETSIGNLSIEPKQESSIESKKTAFDGWGKKNRRKIYIGSVESALDKKKDSPRSPTENSSESLEQMDSTASTEEENMGREKSHKTRKTKGGNTLSIINPIRDSFLIDSSSRKSSYYGSNGLKSVRDSDNTSIKFKGNSEHPVHLDHLETLETLFKTKKANLERNNTTSTYVSSPSSDRSTRRSREWGKGSRDFTPHRKSQRSVSLNPSRTIRNSRAVSSESVVNDVRPKSVDTIQDAVQAYLRSPRLSQKIKHPQTGRLISFSEVGDSEGFAVFCCVGMGLTRYITAFYDELASTLKLRLITPDRPGVGESEPYSDGTSTPLSWPDDVYAICQALKINKFSILAHSAGAIYALATALRMPQHIRGRIHLLAPWIPPSQMCVIGGQVGLPPNNSLPTSQRILRALPTPILKAANSGFMSAASSSMTSSLPKQKRAKRKSTGREVSMPSSRGPTDKENSSDPIPLESIEMQTNGITVKERLYDYESRLTNAIWNLSIQGANPAVDLLVCLERRHTIGFRYVDITRAVVIHHGSKDNRVPVENVIWMGKTMKRCEVRVIQGEGHSLMTSASIMSGILTEIAQDWEDWTKVTNSTGVNRNERCRKALKEISSSGTYR